MDADSPVLSVICAMHNEAARAQAFAVSVLKQLGAAAGPHELLFGLDGCTDGTYDVLASVTLRDPRVRIIVQRHRRGKAAMLRELITLARGRILIFTDGDVRWCNGVVETIVQRFAAGSEPRLVAGRPIPEAGAGAGLLQRVNGLAFDVWDLVRSLHGRGGELWAVSGQLYAVSRALVDLFTQSTPVNEDAHAGHVARCAGAIVEYVPAAAVMTPVPSTWPDFFAQKVRTRVGWRQLEREHGCPVGPLQRDLRRATWTVGRQSGSLREAALLLAFDAVCRLIAATRYNISGASGWRLWRRIGQRPG